MRKRKISEDKDRRLEMIEMDETTAKLLPALEEAVQFIKKTHPGKWPETFGLIVATNHETKELRIAVIDSMDDISDNAKLHMIPVPKDQFLNL